MTAPTAPRYSTRELQAAAEALAAGRFAATGEAVTAPADVHDPRDVVGPAPARAVTDPQSTTGAGAGLSRRRNDPAFAGLASLVRVRAASSGAGASTITLALAEAADVTGVRTRVLDAAAPEWSGLLGATVTELGAAQGWRRGRRGNGTLIDRVEGTVRAPAEVPAPRPTDGVDLTLLDAGWSMRELATAEPGWVASIPADVEALVTRPTALALSQTEAALADLEDQVTDGRVVVIVVGPNRWNDRELGAPGRLLRHLHEQEAVLFAPLLPVRTLPGLGPDPLPKQLTNPAQRLLERITTITGPLSASRT